MTVITADTCPICQRVHGQTDPFWCCPEHGHRLVKLRDDGDFEIYTCLARYPRPCRYTRSAPRKPKSPSKGDPMTTVQTRPTAPVDLMWHRKAHIQAILPDHIDVKSFIGGAQAALYANADLMAAAEADPASLMVALMECATLGHQPGSKEYYLTPRGKGGKRNATVLGIEGYRGVIERMYRSGAVQSVIVREVCAKDNFSYIEGQMDRPVHNFGGGSLDGTGTGFFGAGRDRGEMVGVYAYAIMDSGAVSRVVILSREDVLAARDAGGYKASDPYSPWNREDGGPNFKGRAMWWKTAAHRLEPWVPTSAEYRREQARAAAQAAPPQPSWSAEAVMQQQETAAIEQPERYVRAVPQIRRGDIEGLRKAIADQFDAIGVPPEGDERDNYLHQLANKDADLTERDLRFALDSLATCADLQALVELCNPGDAAS